MDLEDIYAEGVDAAEEILSKALRYEIRKSLNPLHLPDFEKITRSIAKTLKGHALPVEDTALKKAMSALDAKWTDMTGPARGKLLDHAFGYIGKPVANAVLPKVEQTLAFAAKDIIPATKKNSILTYDLKIAPDLSLTDERIEKYANGSLAHYVTDKYGGLEFNSIQRAREIVSQGLAKGLGSADISEQLRGELAMKVGRGGGYWDIIAGVFANRARTMTQLAAFHDAGITIYTWESVLDEATSVQCRFMHGRTFQVKHAMNTFDRVEQETADGESEAVKTLQPFLQAGKTADGQPGIYYNKPDGAGRAFVAHVEENAVGQKDKIGSFSHAHEDADLAAAGIHAPPIHGRCFPGHVVVEGTFTGGLRAVYSGELLEIETVGGRRLVTTPHHEILTSKGGVLAKLLAQGDDLACYAGSVGGDIEKSSQFSSVRQKYENHGPTTIEEAFRLLEHARESRAVDRRSLDLHGDELSFDGDVQIVGAEGELLRHSDDASTLKGAGDVGLEKANVAGACLVGHGPGARPVGGLRFPSSRGPSATALPLYERPVGPDLLPLEPLRIGTVSQIDVARLEPSQDDRNGDVQIGSDSIRRISGEVASHDGAIVEGDTRSRLSFSVAPHVDARGEQGDPERFVADSGFLAKVLDRFPGLVAKDQVRQVRNLGPSTLHVFDLQTDRGWFVADGIFVANCRSTIIPGDEIGGGGSGATAAPPTPAGPPPKLTSGQAKAKAMELLEVAQTLGDPEYLNPNHLFAQTAIQDDPPHLEHPFFSGSDAPGWHDGWTANAVSKKPKLDELIPTAPDVLASEVKGYIQKPKSLDAAAAPKVVKLNDKLYVISGHEQLAAQKLLGQKVAYCDVVDLDKAIKPAPLVNPVEPPPAESALGHVIHPVEPAAPPPPPPLSPALGHPAPHLDGSTILGTKTGNAEGSNAGGFYKGTDGVERYVKFYKDPAQAEGEHLANSIYRDMGHLAPVSNVFEHEGEKAYASDIIHDAHTLKEMGLSATNAKEVMKGFVADVLVGNWDVVGQDLDNVMINGKGQAIRIDNGGSFLMRAKAGRKPESVLNQITEWDKFFGPGNPSYQKVAQKAGYMHAGDMKDLILPEIKKVTDLRDAHGGWTGYVNKLAPGLKADDKVKIVEMLDARTKLLEDKAHELSRPAPPDPMQPLIGHLPSKALPPDSMPVPEGRGEAHYKEIAASRLPSNPEQREGVRYFTGGNYSTVRDVEKAQGDPAKIAALPYTPTEIRLAKQASEQIEGFFRNPETKPTPATVYRGIKHLDDWVVRKLMADEEFDMLATTSTSRTPSVAKSFGNISTYGTSNRAFLILKQRSAVAVETISKVRDEDELVLHKSTRFRVTGRYKAEGMKNVLIIEAEEVGNDLGTPAGPLAPEKKPRKPRAKKPATG